VFHLNNGGAPYLYNRAKLANMGYNLMEKAEGEIILRDMNVLPHTFIDKVRAQPADYPFSRPSECVPWGAYKFEEAIMQRLDKMHITAKGFSSFNIWGPKITRPIHSYYLLSDEYGPPVVLYCVYYEGILFTSRPISVM